MNIPEHWGRVAAFAIDEQQNAGAVWLATEDHNEVTLYDSCVFGDLPIERIAEALRVRGKAIPIAWEVGQKSVAESLLHEGGCNMIPELDAVTEDDSFAAMVSRDLAERLNKRRLVVGEREVEWRREYDLWRRAGTAVASTPLLRATRLALARLSYARVRPMRGARRPNYPNVSVI